MGHKLFRQGITAYVVGNGNLAAGAIFVIC